MRDRPILFSGPMVRALLTGTKTQTRRAIKPPYGTMELTPAGWVPIHTKVHTRDRLWVRETWGHDWFDDGNSRAWKRIVYRADPGAQALDNGGPAPWKPSIHMPRRASRLTLTVTDVRVERLQDISEADALAEGCALECMTPTGDDSGSAIWGPGGFVALWESINGAGSWEANPWVAAYTFTVGRHNIDNPTGAS